MELSEHIREIQDALRKGTFVNEASVSQGIVLRLLQALGWPIFDSKVVSPEYTVEGRRVDFALCHPALKPIVFVEVKKVGEGEGGDRQLFEYAFYVGVPMAVLTNGQEWHFYLPGEQGSYEERRVYKLDILGRDVDESEKRLRAYLYYQALCSGSAIEAAKQDYRDVARQRTIQSALPQAWRKLIEDQDESLVELIANETESLCGYKPDSDTVAEFLAAGVRSQAVADTQSAARPITASLPAPAVSASGQGLRGVGFSLYGAETQARNAKDAMIKLIEQLARRDSTFLQRFAARPQGRSRRYVAPDRSDLYPNRPDLCQDYSHQLQSGWWIGTNYSRQAITKIIQMACEVAGIAFGRDLIVNLG